MTTAELTVDRAERSARLSDPDNEARLMVECLREVLAGADDVRRSRIARARTSVQMLVVDPATGEGRGPVLVCDRPEPSLRRGGEPAEITVYLTPEQAGCFCRGDLKLSAALLTGAVRADGPARKFLVVEPIVRSLIGARPDTGRSA